MHSLLRTCIFKRYNLFASKWYYKKYKIREPKWNFGTLTGDRSFSIDEPTLQSRFLLYMKDTLIEQNNEPIRNIDTKDIKKHQYAQLDTVTNNNLYDMICFASKTDIVNTKMELIKLLSKLDKECVNRMSELTINDLLLLLNAFMVVYPHRMLEIKFYNYSIQRLCLNLNHGTKLQLIQLCFYVSLQKKTKKASRIIQQCLKIIVQNYLNLLTLYDLSIICSASFKTSTKINEEQILQKVLSTIYGDLSILKDPGIFVTLIKTVRQNRFQNNELLSTISNVVFFNKTIEHYSFTANCHLLALYADALFYDEELFKLIIGKCIEQLQQSTCSAKLNTYFAHQIRGKDIARFLWATSFLGHRIDPKIIETVIVPRLKERIRLDEFKNDADVIIDCVLCLWMLNYQPKEIIYQVLTTENISKIRGSKLSRCKMRLNLLLTSVLMENRQLYNSLNVDLASSFACGDGDDEYQLSKRKTINRAYEILKSATRKSEITRYELQSQIPHLTIIGITGYKNKIDKAVFIEVMDSFVCVANKENHANGLMQLKLRLLKSFSCPTVIIYEDEVKDLSDKELKEHLEEEMLLACG